MDIIIDKEDEERVNKYNWRPSFNGYAVTYINRKTTLLHRYILNAKKGEIVDHINRNKLDNRRCNLRICTQSQNLYNRGLQSNNTSGISGVHFRKDINKWAATIKVKGKLVYLGHFLNKEDAIKTRKNAELVYIEEPKPTTIEYNDIIEVKKMPNVGKQSARKKIIEELYTLKYNKPMQIKDIMKMLYVENNKTQNQIAEELHVSLGTVNAWLADSGIPGKKMKWI